MPKQLTMFLPENQLNKEFLSVSDILITYHKIHKIEINLNDTKDFYMQETVSSFNGQLGH